MLAQCLASRCASTLFVSLTWLLAATVTLTSSASALAAQEPNQTIELAPRHPETGLRVADDLRLDLVLRDPQIANPLYLNFDERGRMWLVEYRQYPWPAGLKLVSRDNVWRNAYEPPLAPPPPHAIDSPFRGRDRISVHEDTNGDGTFDQSRVFLDGLNLATAALAGRGGVYVMNPPYLLFYPDADHDAQPDTDSPRILLSGFGIEDTHSIANSLRWGPDGWIYATQGSTVSASVVRHGADNQPLPNEKPVHTMGQFVWRYHPERHLYEVFAEGGGNAFGIEFDSAGRVYSGHNGGDTRGFYYVQGGYYLKNFGKHGSHSNPFTFGHYPSMRHPAVERFTHTFEIYEGQALPERYRGKLIGTAPHLHYVVASEIFSDGSSRQSRDLGKILAPGDQPRDDWFSPVDVQTGPDGNLYLADWYSVQVNHYKNHEGQTNPDLGRVYRLRSNSELTPERSNLALAGDRELVEKWLVHPNRWQRETALRLLAERKPRDLAPLLQTMLASESETAALNGLWALYQTGSFTSAIARIALQHPQPMVRAWSVRLIGDEARSESSLLVDAVVRERLAVMATNDPSPEVRLQIACTARKLPAPIGLKLLGDLLVHDSDASDVFLPQAIWWGVEAHADARDLVVAWSRETDYWNSKLAQAGSVFPNLVRRYAMLGSKADLETSAELLASAPSSEAREQLAAGLLQAYQGRSLPPLPERLLEQLSQVSGPYATLLGLRRGEPNAFAAALQTVQDATADEAYRIDLIRTLGEIRGQDLPTMQLLLGQLNSHPKPALAVALLAALQRASQPEVGSTVLRLYSNLPPESREAALSLLASREVWAGQLLAAVDAGSVPAEAVTSDIRQRLRMYHESGLSELRDRLFPVTVDEAAMLGARLEAVEAIARQGSGNPLRGQDLFHGTASCGKCHKMFTRGGEIGPDLTSYNRNQLRLLLMAIVNPSAEVREGYETLTVTTLDGRLLSGFKLEDLPDVLVLRSADGQAVSIAKADIDELAPSKLSLMPSGLLDSLSEEQIRDLLAFLTSTTPPL